MCCVLVAGRCSLCVVCCCALCDARCALCAACSLSLCVGCSLLDVGCVCYVMCVLRRLLSAVCF